MPDPDDKSAHHKALDDSVPEAHKLAEWAALYRQDMAGVVACSEAGVFLRVNRAFAEMLGYAPAELELRRKWSDVASYDDIEPGQREAAAAWAGSIPGYRLAMRFRHKRGHEVWIDMRVLSVEVGSRISHMIGFVREMRLQDHETRVETDADGKPVLKPVETLQSVLSRYWKWLAGGGSAALLALVTGAGGLLNNYYGAIAREQATIRELTELREGRVGLVKKIDDISTKAEEMRVKNAELLQEMRQIGRNVQSQAKP